MIVCVTADGDNLEAQVDSRFARCNYFLFVDTETLKYEAVKNPFKDADHGAGPQAVQFVLDRGAEKIITGNIGPKAEMILKSAGIEVIFGSGKVKDVIKNL